VCIAIFSLTCIESVCALTLYAYYTDVIIQQKRPLSTKGSKHTAAAATAYEWVLEGGAGRVGKGEDPRDATCLTFISLSKQNNGYSDDQENSYTNGSYADAYSSSTSVVRTLAGTDKGEVSSSC
jgi:hypothetical protein